MEKLIMLFGVIGALVIGYMARHYVVFKTQKGKEKELEEKLIKAKKEALLFEEQTVASLEKRNEEIRKREEHIRLLEERIYKKEEDIQKREEEVEKAKSTIRTQEVAMEKRMESIASLTKEEARIQMLASLHREYEEDTQRRLIKLSLEGEKRLEDKARDMLVNAVYRLGNSTMDTFFTSVVPLPDEESKGKIIGKEGRNIRAFERFAGVDVLIDEMPNAIVVSCFDPVRRAIAVNALLILIKDGRIQPAKIEEVLEKAKKDIGVFIHKKGEEALREAHVLSMPEAIIPILGRLYFRTSYGQNVLTHSIEMAHIAGMLAKELGVDEYVARAGALLHDIGKAVDHEVQGTHVEIGRKILTKYGVDERVMLAMQAHHEEYPYETLESVIVQVSDAISGGRPGARRDTVERYVERLEQLEALAMAFSGIEKVYALQAGREIRVFVSPTLVSDMEARNMARNIALRIEEELRYPGEIKVHVIRESRVIEFAR